MEHIKIKELVYNLEDSFEGEPWYGSALMKILEKVNPKLVNQKIIGQYSVANVLQHTINWRIFTIKMLENEIEFDIEMNSESDWKDLDIKNELEWQALVNDFQTAQKQLIQLLKTKTDDFLKKQVPNRNYNFYFLINGILQHDIYHFGQIAVINRVVQNN